MDKAQLLLLPLREPRGSPANILRMYMVLHLSRGYPRDEAERMARASMRRRKEQGWNCVVRYRDGSQSIGGAQC
jgi:hypothetical protein